jgi:hypothetical protein
MTMKQQEVIFQENYVVIGYRREMRLVISHWKGPVTIDEFRHAIDFLISFIEQNPVLYVLTDTREQAVVSKESTDYAANAAPRLIASGVKNMLFILPTSLFTLMSVDMYKEKLGNDDTTMHFAQYFDNPDDALAWIEASKMIDR